MGSTSSRCQAAVSCYAVHWHRRNFRLVQGVRVPPPTHFLKWRGTVPPTFKRYKRPSFELKVHRNTWAAGAVRTPPAESSTALAYSRGKNRRRRRITGAPRSVRRLPGLIRFQSLRGGGGEASWGVVRRTDGTRTHRRCRTRPSTELTHLGPYSLLARTCSPVARSIVRRFVYLFSLFVIH